MELAMTLTGTWNNVVTWNVKQVTNSNNTSKHKRSVDKASNDKSNKRPNNSFKAETRRYSTDDWKVLTQDLKTQVKSLHKLLEGSRQILRNTVVSVNEGASIVSYGANMRHNDYRQYIQMNFHNSISHSPTQIHIMAFIPQSGDVLTI